MIVLATGSVVLLVALIGGFNLVLRQQVHADLDSRLAERASAALSNVVVHRGRLTVREAPDDQAIDQQVWVFASGRSIEAPREPRQVSAAARMLASRAGAFMDVPAADV